MFLPRVEPYESVSFAVGKHVADNPEGDRSQEDVHHVLQKNVGCVFGPREIKLKLCV